MSAQNGLSDAEAVLVQARYANLLALAGLESILGERLFPDDLEKACDAVILVPFWC